MLGDSVRRRQPRRGRPTARDLTGRRFDWRPLLVAVPLALIVPFAIGYAIAVFVLFPPTQVRGSGIAVPELVGRSAADAQRALAAAGLGAIEASDLPHPNAPAGQVLAQSPLAGQHLRAGTGVRVALSSGPPLALVPDAVGFSAERAESLLRRTGFEVSTTLETSTAPRGRVLRIVPDPGTPLRLPSLVTLVVSSGPPDAGLVPGIDSAAGDTLDVE